MSKYLVSDTQLTSVANAIRTKGGTSNSLSFPDGFVSAIGNIPSGGSTPSSGPVVKFYDYDGTLITTKTKDEVNAMTSDSDLPANPSHTGLVAEGWNWTVSDLKAQLLACPESDIFVGQTYNTPNGDTIIGITLASSEALSPKLGILIKGSVSIDWGDGTEPSIGTGNTITSVGSTTYNTKHTYASIGNYVITIHLIDGDYAFYNNNTKSILYFDNASTADVSRVYATCVNYVRFGSGLNKIYGYAAFNASNLTSVTISKNIITKSIGASAFQSCYSLSCIIIPKGFTFIGASAFSNCYSLETVSLPESIRNCDNEIFKSDYRLKNIIIPYGLTTLGNSIFYGCYKLKFMELPSTIESIGNDTFNSCYSLEKVVIHFSGTNLFKSGLFNTCYMLDTIVYTLNGNETNLGASCFNYCYNLKSFTIPNTITSIGNYVFQYTRFETISIPNSVTSIGSYSFYNMFCLKEIAFPPNITILQNSVCANCYSLKKVTIPEGVKNINNSAFTGCYSLSEITIPSTVTSIGTSAFASDKALRKLILLPTTPPTLSNVNTFSNLSSNCKLYVPYSADHSVLNDYMTANYWSTWASQMEELPAPTT